MSRNDADNFAPTTASPSDISDLRLRPLTARSVILSVLLGSHPPLLPVRSLVRTAALFGINEGTTRVALSRLAAEGDVVADGRRYRLSDRLVDRQRRQDESRTPATRPWRGYWEVALVDLAFSASAERAAWLEELTSLRLGEWQGGVWVRPANLLRPWPPEIGHQVRCFEARPVGADRDARELAARVWDLAGWADLAEALLQGWASADTPSQRFMVAAAMVRHLRTDPVLPAALLPARWPGSRLRDAYAAYEEELSDLLGRQQVRPG